MIANVMKEYDTEKLIIMTKHHSRNEYTIFKSSSLSRSAIRSIIIIIFDYEIQTRLL